MRFLILVPLQSFARKTAMSVVGTMVPRVLGRVSQASGSVLFSEPFAALMLSSRCGPTSLPWTGRGFIPITDTERTREFQRNGSKSGALFWINQVGTQTPTQQSLAPEFGRRSREGFSSCLIHCMQCWWSTARWFFPEFWWAFSRSWAWRSHERQSPPEDWHGHTSPADGGTY